MYSIDDVAKTDKDIADLIEAELARFRELCQRPGHAGHGKPSYQ